MPEFTPTQGRYLAYIHSYMEGFGLPPAESEIAKAIGVEAPSVNQMMKTLEKKGLIRRKPGVARSIEILVKPETIPKWKGKRILRVVREWTLTKPPLRDTMQTGTTAATVYRFKIELLGTDPAIWRLIETRDVTLRQLHELIQAAMGWDNSHMHEFRIADQRYGDAQMLEDDGVIDDDSTQVSGLVEEHGKKLRMEYEYDFGDSWLHKVKLERVSQPELGIKYPLCLDGACACPPEDVGGVYGFADFVEAITNPAHSGHDEYLDAYGKFIPDEFDAAKATKRMRRYLPAS